MKLDDLRREYLRGGLRHEELDADPFQQFKQWMQQAVELEVVDPTAMVLATVSAEGRPSQRIVLLKGCDQQGFVFYTSYRSLKARDMEANAGVSLLFPWNSIDRQVRVYGRVERTSVENSRDYFASRPRDSQLAACASPQSRAIPSRQSLLDELESLRERYADVDVPMPENWGGYRVVAEKFEFWQGGANRLHDRFQYDLQADGTWQISRLAP